MKTYTFGIVAVAILVVMTGIGFGIAQAGGNHFERPVLSFADMEALEQGSPSSSYQESRPVLSFEDEESLQVAKSTSEEMQPESPIETGSFPAGMDIDTSSFDISGILYRGGVDTGP